MQTKSFASRLTLMVCGAGLMLTAACVGPTAPDGPDGPEAAEPEAIDDAPAADQTPGERPAMRMHEGKHHMGLLHAALDQLELSDSQKAAIEKLQEDLRPTEADRQTHQALDAALAAQVKAGSINAAELGDEIDAIKAKMASKRAAHVKALNGLHGILSAEQRVQLVDGIQAQRGQWAGKHPDGDMDGPPRGKRGKRGMRGPDGKMGRDPLGRMLRGLNLTDEQRTKLDAARDAMKSERPDREAMKARFSEMKEKMDAFLTSFKSDDFDASTMPEPPMADMMTKRLDHKIKALETVVPILTAEQRARLSERMLQAPDFERGPHKRGGHRHGAPEMN